MRNFFNWLFNPAKAGQASFLFVGFVFGMGIMSFYIGTMTKTGSLADWLGAIGTLAAVVFSLYYSLDGKRVSLDYSFDITITRRKDDWADFPSNVFIDLYGFNTGKSSDAIRKIEIVLSDRERQVFEFNLSKDNIAEIKPESYVKWNDVIHSVSPKLYGYALDKDKTIEVTMTSFRGKKYTTYVKPSVEIGPAWRIIKLDNNKFYATNFDGDILTLNDINDDGVVDTILKNNGLSRTITHLNDRIKLEKTDAELLLERHKKEFRDKVK